MAKLQSPGASRAPELKSLAAEFSGFRELPEESVAEIGAKAKHYEKLRGKADFTRAQAAADLYVAAFLLPKTGEPPVNPSGRTVPTTAELRHAWKTGHIPEAMSAAPAAARRARAFHWPLEFPDVMERGGFDVVLGNPPWERIKLQEQEFFAARSPEIAGAPNKAARDRLIKALETAPEGSPERALFAQFVAAKREAEATSEFVRVPSEEGGRFALTGRGDVNTYALFAEHFANLSRSRAGIIVPTGIATDATTAPFFAHLVESKRLARLVDFENSSPLFPGVHRSFKFSLLTLGRDEAETRFAFFLTEPAQLAEAERNFTLSPETIAQLNPNTKTAPVFRSREDAELTAKIYRNAPALVISESNPNQGSWQFDYATKLFDMADDSPIFADSRQLLNDGFKHDRFAWLAQGKNELSKFVPLYEAKMVHHYDHRWSGYTLEDGTSVEYHSDFKANADNEAIPRYWVDEREVRRRIAAKGWMRSWLMGWRDITNATNERTVVASVVPWTAVGHTLRLMQIGNAIPKSAAFLANATSLTLDFVARQKVGGTHLTVEMWKQFPMLPPTFYTAPRLDFIVPRVLELTYTSHSLAPFARDLGYDGPPFAWDEDRRAKLRAELDAFYARAYGLERDELRYILDPADVKGPDYPSETFRVLKEKEIRHHGEYRTRRLVLEAWDWMEASGEFFRMEL